MSLKYLSDTTAASLKSCILCDENKCDDCPEMSKYALNPKIVESLQSAYDRGIVDSEEASLTIRELKKQNDELHTTLERSIKLIDTLRSDIQARVKTGREQFNNL